MELREHYASEHWANKDQRNRSDKLVERWHDEEHNADRWYFKPDHEHETVRVK